MIGRQSEAIMNLEKSLINYDKYIGFIPSLASQQQVYEKYLPIYQEFIDECIRAGDMEKALHLLDQLSVSHLWANL